MSENINHENESWRQPSSLYIHNKSNENVRLEKATRKDGAHGFQLKRSYKVVDLGTFLEQFNRKYLPFSGTSENNIKICTDFLNIICRRLTCFAQIFKVDLQSLWVCSWSGRNGWTPKSEVMLHLHFSTPTHSSAMIINLNTIFTQSPKPGQTFCLLLLLWTCWILFWLLNCCIYQVKFENCSKKLWKTNWLSKGLLFIRPCLGTREAGPN